MRELKAVDRHTNSEGGKGVGAGRKITVSLRALPPGDAVADRLSLPIDSISLEMIYRGLYHFYVARQQGKTTDPREYFALKRKSRFRYC